MEDYAAYTILGVFYIFGIMPLVGSWFSESSFTTYADDWSIGLVAHIVLLTVVACTCAIVWAIYHVSGAF